MKRDFNSWLETFRKSICDYNYYVDFEKVFFNVESIKVELNILNSLIGSKNIKEEFKVLLKKYPEILKAIPILLAKRESEIYCQDENGAFWYRFAEKYPSNAHSRFERYSYFMEKTGLFDLLKNHIINNLVDYVTGVEVGLDSNGRKNRGGHLMENLVESYFQKKDLSKVWTISKKCTYRTLKAVGILIYREFQIKEKRKNVLIS